jgi:predicted transcriptional regulator
VIKSPCKEKAMGKKVTVEMEDDALYKDLQEISRLVKEPPEELLRRAFREWVQLREDLEDA